MVMRNRTVVCLLLVAGWMLFPAHAWVSGYAARANVTVAIGSNQTDYTASTNLSHDADMRNDFGDVQPAWANDTLIPFLIVEKVDGVWALIDFKANFDTFNRTGLIYLYYQKPAATSASLGNFTYLVWDDFLGTSLSGDWDEVVGSAVVSGGEMSIDATDELNYTAAVFGQGYAFGIRAKSNEQDWTYGWGVSNTFGYLSRGASIINSDGADDGNFTMVGYRSRQSDQETEYKLSIDTRNYFTTEVRRISTSLIEYLTNGVSRENRTTQVPDADLTIYFYEYGQASTTTVDWIYIRKSIRPEPVVTISGEEKTGVSFSFTPALPVVNQSIEFVASWESGNFTKFWWDFNDTSELNYTADPVNRTTHEFNTSGTYDVELTAYNADTTSNVTATEAVKIYAIINTLNITISDYMPFIFTANGVNLNFTFAGGTPVFNSSWNITLPNTTIFNYVNQSPLAFSPPAHGTHSITLTVCDLGDSTCISDTDTFRPWNISGGTFSAAIFNATDRLAATVLVGDSVTFSSADSLIWNLSTASTQGTSTELTFNSTYAFWNNSDYFHYNISLFNSWGSYEATDWFTVVAARFNLTTDCSTGNSYCFIYGTMHDEETLAVINSSNVWAAYLVTTTAADYEEEHGLTFNGYALNISLCMNATATFTDLTLDGHITYEASGYVQRMHAFDAASMPITSACSFANGNQFEFYTASNTSTVYSTTITVLEGGAALADALVQVEYYFNDTGTGEGWAEVASQLTDSVGQVQLNLELCPIWYKFKISQDGELLHEEKTCLKSISHTIAVEGSLSEFYQIYEDLTSVCAWNNATEYLSCSITEPTGRTVEAELSVYSSLSDTAICTSSEASASTTLLCDMSGHPDGDYGFKVLAKTLTKPDGYIINSGGFTKGLTDTITQDGALLGLLLITVALFGARLHPLLMVIVATLGFIALGTMGLIAVPYSVVGWLLAMGMVVVAVII